MLNQKQVERIRQTYPPGTRILLEDMVDQFAPVCSGMRGSVVHVDDAGQIHMKWDNGRSLALIPELDSFRTLSEAELAEEASDPMSMEEM